MCHLRRRGAFWDTFRPWVSRAHVSTNILPAISSISAAGCVRPTCEKAGRHAGLAARDAKHFAADVCGRLPEMQKTWRPMFAVGCPRCKKLCGRCLRSAARDAKQLCGRCLRSAARDAKNLVADVCGRLPEMSKLGGRCLRSTARDAKTWRPMFAVGCRRCKNLAADVCGRLPEMQNFLADVCGWLPQKVRVRPAVNRSPNRTFRGLSYTFINRLCVWAFPACKNFPGHYGGSRQVGTCPQEQMGPKPQVSTLISEAKVGTWSETRQRESWNLYCRERGTAITTTAPVLQRNRNYNCYDRSSIANSKKNAITTTAPLLQREGNCNYHDRSNAERERETVIIATLSNIAEREKLELLGPLQYCRDRNCNYCDPSSMAEREIAINYYDRSSIAERYVYGDPTIIPLYSQWYDPMDRRRT